MKIATLLESTLISVEYKIVRGLSIYIETKHQKKLTVGEKNECLSEVNVLKI